MSLMQSKHATSQITVTAFRRVLVGRAPTRLYGFAQKDKGSQVTDNGIAKAQMERLAPARQGCRTSRQYPAPGDQA
jgi:hypothetical protein